jgi:hypothetical protein
LQLLVVALQSGQHDTAIRSSDAVQLDGSKSTCT